MIDQRIYYGQKDTFVNIMAYFCSKNGLKRTNKNCTIDFNVS